MTQSNNKQVSFTGIFHVLSYVQSCKLQENSYWWNMINLKQSLATKMNCTAVSKTHFDHKAGVTQAYLGHLSRTPCNFPSLLVKLCVFALRWKALSCIFILRGVLLMALYNYSGLIALWLGLYSFWHDLTLLFCLLDVFPAALPKTVRPVRRL